MEEHHTPSSGLIYGLDDRPPFREALFAALQHLLAIFVAIITPPLIIAGALGLDLETTGFLVSMALFASGVSTFIQCRRIGPVGTGLLCVQGTSFSFIGPIIAAVCRAGWEPCSAPVWPPRVWRWPSAGCSSTCAASLPRLSPELWLRLSG